MSRSEETEWYLSRDTKLNTRNVLDAAYEECVSEEGKTKLLHAILYINGSAWVRDNDAVG